MKDFLNNIKARLNRLFYGRQGMDELSKYLFWVGIAVILLTSMLSLAVENAVFSLLRTVGIILVVFSFFRAFSRNIPKREAENGRFLLFLTERSRKRQAAKERFSQRKDFVFFKCPGCGTILRVPRGKGKIHITCRCGYTLYRKT